MNEFEVSEELEGNENNLSQFMPKSHEKGPYSKQDKEARRDEVYRLHFEYGYSSRKIEGLMRVNRNTINRDLGFWYSRIMDNSKILEPELIVEVNLERLDIQYTRLRESLDKTDLVQEKNMIEKLMLDVNSKINYTVQRRADSHVRMRDLVTECLNDWMKDNRKETRFLTLSDIIEVSTNAHKKIKRIIEEDRKMGDPDFN